jgi:uncharacterized protein (TIGR03086 family)
MLSQMGTDDLLNLLERVVNQAGSVVADVSPGQAGLPTPCRSWDVRALVEHIIDDLGQFTAAARGGRPDWSEKAPAVGGDWATAFSERAPALLAAWRDAGDLSAAVHLPMGDLPRSFVVNQQIAEFIVHTWDLAAATGQDRALDPEAAARALDWAGGALLPAYRGSEEDGMVFGPEAPCPDGAQAADRLAAYFGRDPRFAGEAG